MRGSVGKMWLTVGKMSLTVGKKWQGISPP